MPTDRPVRLSGRDAGVEAAAVDASRRRWRRSLVASENVSVALVLPVSAGGPVSIVVSGAVVVGRRHDRPHVRGGSRVDVAGGVRRADLEDVLSGAEPVYWRGDVQALYAPPSSLHSNVADSLAENSKIALVASVVPCGPESTVVSGGVASTTVHV